MDEPSIIGTLRSATSADAPRVASLLIETRRAFMPYAPLAHAEADVHEWVANVLMPTSGVTVAEVNGQVVGVMATEVKDRASWIMQMAVDPSMVGQGIGSSLLAHALGTLVLPIRLYTFQPNSGARRFYERHGFVAIQLTDGRDTEEKCPDVLYEYEGPASDIPVTSY